MQLVYLPKHQSFRQQKLSLEDGCNVDQNFFGHKAAFFSCVSYKSLSELAIKKNYSWVSATSR